MAAYPLAVSRLIDNLERLPGVGPKSAQRLSLWLLRQPPDRVRGLADSIRSAVDDVRLCPDCGFFTESERCGLCGDMGRDDSLLCVIGDAGDLLAIEATGEYRGRYHVLGGLLSPLDGIGPAELNIKRLLERAQEPEVVEVIVALNPTAEGDTTATYLARALRQRGMRVTRPALGLPVGGDIDHADPMTLTRALEGRMEL